MSRSLAPITAGRLVFTAVGLMLSIGPYVADFNHTHVYNPNWPPHARFHNGQTMSFGLLLGLLTLYNTWRPSSHQSAESVHTTAIFGGIYFVAGMSAILYPGAKGMDPEFGEGFPQAKIFSTMLGMSFLAWFLESRNLAAKGKLA